MRWTMCNNHNRHMQRTLPNDTYHQQKEFRRHNLALSLNKDRPSQPRGLKYAQYKNQHFQPAIHGSSISFLGLQT